MRRLLPVAVLACAMWCCARRGRAVPGPLPAHHPAAAGGQLADGPRRAGGREPARRGDQMVRRVRPRPTFGQRRRSRRCRAGTEDVPVRPPSPGLEPSRRVYWRVVATNAAGHPPLRPRALHHAARARRRDARRSSRSTCAGGAALIVRGPGHGRGVAGITVALQRAAVPVRRRRSTDVGTERGRRRRRLRLRRRAAARHDALPGRRRARRVLAQSAVLTAYSALAWAPAYRAARPPRRGRRATVAGTRAAAGAERARGPAAARAPTAPG